MVWAENVKPNPRLDNRLKDVEEKLELPPLKPELRNFVDWVANYTVSSRGMVLRMCLRMGEHLGAERERVGVRSVTRPPTKVSEKPDAQGQDILIQRAYVPRPSPPFGKRLDSTSL